MQNSSMTKKPNFADQSEPKKRGRPAIAPKDRAVVGSLRLTAARWEKLRQIGMAKLNAWIDKAKAP